MICPNCNNEISELPCPFCPSDLPEDSYGLPVGLFVGSILSDEIKRNKEKKKKIQTTLVAAGVIVMIVIVVIAVFGHFTGRNAPPPVAPVVTVTTPERPAPPVLTTPESDEPLPFPEEPEVIYHPDPEEVIEPPEVEISIDEIVDALIARVIEYPVFIAEDFELDPRMVLHIAYEDLTDEILIAFLDAFDITYTSWFTFDFGDETGYVFGGGNHTHFSYGILSEDGFLSEYYYAFGFADIINGIIEWNFRVDVPHFDTVAEYLQWATGNGLELTVLNREFEPVEDIQSVLHREIFEHPEPIFGDAEVIIVIDDE